MIWLLNFSNYNIQIGKNIKLHGDFSLYSKIKGDNHEHTTTSHILYVITIFFFGDLMGPIGMEHQSIIFPTKNGYNIKIVFAFINLIHCPNCFNISSFNNQYFYFLRNFLKQLLLFFYHNQK